mmetsp:Transcript_10528/g.31435  ORF Transcript_10528/g.31435 Transcript_10528/m.31435 type:complete len:324 (-) Transcript_10528:17-988(-)
MHRASLLLLPALCAGFLRAPASGAPRRAIARRVEQEVQEVTSDDPLVQRIAAEVAEINAGASMDALLNPAKLINIERELIELRAQRDAGDDSDELQQKIEKKESVAYVEKRAVMRDWLKDLFRGQAYATVVVSLLLVYDVVPFFSPVDLSVRVLGFWSWWLFIVPSLRSVKPLPPPEKRALDAAFLATLVSSLAAPFATKDPAAIWWIDAATVGACYAYGYLAPEPTVVEEDDLEFDAAQAGGAGAFGQQLWRSAKWAGRALDFGAGRERGARSEEASAVERALQESLSTKAEALVAEEEVVVAPPLGDLGGGEDEYEAGFKA